MGGGITARYLQPGRPSVKKVDAALLSSPMLEIVGLVPGLSAEIVSCCLARAAVALGAGADWHWVGGPYVPVDVQQNEHTSSPVRTERMIDKERAAAATQLGSPTWGWIARSCDAAKATRVEATKITTPLLVMIARQDQIVLSHGATQLCQRLAAGGAGCGGPAGGPVLIEGAQHETLMQRDALRGQALSRALAVLQQPGR